MIIHFWRSLNWNSLSSGIIFGCICRETRSVFFYYIVIICGECDNCKPFFFCLNAEKHTILLKIKRIFQSHVCRYCSVLLHFGHHFFVIDFSFNWPIITIKNLRKSPESPDLTVNGWWRKLIPVDFHAFKTFDSTFSCRYFAAVIKSLHCYKITLHDDCFTFLLLLLNFQRPYT